MSWLVIVLKDDILRMELTKNEKKLFYPNWFPAVNDHIIFTKSFRKMKNFFFNLQRDSYMLSANPVAVSSKQLHMKNYV